MASDFEDIMKDVAAAVETAESSAGTTEPPAPSPGAAPPAETASAPPPEQASAGERSRDEGGRFAKTETAKLPAEDKHKAAGIETVTPGQQKASQPLNPPANWKGNAKINWQRLPPEVQQALSEDYGGHTKTQSALQELQDAIGDRSQRFVTQYGSLGNALKAVLAGSDMATNQPVEFARWFFKQARLDPSQVFGQGAPPGEQPGAASNPADQELAQLRNEIADLKRSSTQAQQAPIIAEIQRFAADPARPYYKDVEQEMIALLPKIQGTHAERLSKAYEMATWARPDLRADLLKAEMAKEAAAQEAKVASARAAQVSITGSPMGGKVPNEEPDETIEQTVRRHVNRGLAA